MLFTLTDRDRQHCIDLGLENPPESVEIPDGKYQQYLETWENSHPGWNDGDLRHKVIGLFLCRERAKLGAHPSAAGHIVTSDAASRHLAVFSEKMADHRRETGNQLSLAREEVGLALHSIETASVKHSAELLTLIQAESSTTRELLRAESESRLAEHRELIVSNEYQTGRLLEGWAAIENLHQTESALRWGVLVKAAKWTWIVFLFMFFSLIAITLFAPRAHAATCEAHAGVLSWSEGNLVWARCTLDGSLVVTFDAGQTVSVTQGTSPWVVSGTVSVTNFANPLPVTGTFWQATQPVSGTFWQATQPVSGTVAVSSLPSITIGNTTFAATQGTSPWSDNVAQVNGVTTLTGAGATGTGSQRNTVAQDTTTVAGSAPGTAGSASAQVVTVQGVASMTPILANIRGNIGGVVDAVVGAAVPANGLQTCGTDGTNCTVPFIDPCQRAAQNKAVINISTATTTKVITKASSKKNYICSMHLVASAADNIAIIEGTQSSTACDTGAAGMAGGATAATGWNFAANSGLAVGGGGWSIIETAGTNVDTCLVTSGTAQVSGIIKYVQYP